MKALAILAVFGFCSCGGTEDSQMDAESRGENLVLPVNGEYRLSAVYLLGEVEDKRTGEKEELKINFSLKGDCRVTIASDLMIMNGKCSVKDHEENISEIDCNEKSTTWQMEVDFDNDLVKRQVDDERCITETRSRDGTIVDSDNKTEKQLEFEKEFSLIGSKNMIFYNSSYTKKAFETGVLGKYISKTAGGIRMERSVRFYYVKID